MKYKVTLNNKIYEVEVEKGEAAILSEYEAALPKADVAPATVTPVTASVAPPAAPVAASANTVKAPLPGNILAVKVTEGQSVNAGDILIILEAMKMENEIKAPTSGKVGKILVTKGATVPTGAPLIELL